MLGRLIALLALCSCATDVEESPGIIGVPLDESSQLVTREGNSTPYFYLFDETQDRIIDLDIDQMAIRGFFDVQNPDDNHFLIGDPGGRYVIDLTTKGLTIHRSGMDSIIDPVGFQGTPVSAAYNGTSDYVIVYDDLNSVSVLQLSEDGSVEGSWLGGPLFDEGKSIVSGDIGTDGSLILAFTDKTVGVVDLAASISEQKWVFESFAAGEKEILWLAPGPQGRFLGATESEILNIDPVAQTIVETQSAATIAGRFKVSSPHVYGAADDGNPYIWYLEEDGSLTQSLLTGHTVPEVSYLILESMVLTTLHDAGKQIFQFRLSDNLVVASHEIETADHLAIGKDYLLRYTKAPLGFLERRGIADGESSRLTGYNLEAFQ